MKILVAVKQVIDHHVSIQVKLDNTGIETNNVKMSINPFDEIAVEAALRLKEEGVASEVIVVSIGNKTVQNVLRSALAMGADSAIHIETVVEAQPLAVARLLQAIVTQESPQLVILGKQAIDDDSNQTGQMLAGLLNWGQGTNASHLILNEDCIEMTREVDNGLETLSLSLPAVVTTDLRLNKPRYIKLPNIMKAKRKPLTIITPEVLEVDITPHLHTLKVELPPQRSAGVDVSSVDELINKLKTEAQVI
jgi:electron transfer flavoprotein beta subunit